MTGKKFFIRDLQYSLKYSIQEITVEILAVTYIMVLYIARAVRKELTVILTVMNSKNNVTICTVRIVQYCTVYSTVYTVCLSGLFLCVCVNFACSGLPTHHLGSVKVQRNLARYCKEGNLPHFFSLSHTHRNLYQLFAHLRGSSFSPPTSVAGTSSAVSHKT